jgi:hypothetical protein
MGNKTSRSLLAVGLLATAAAFTPARAALSLPGVCVDGTEICVRVDTAATRGTAKRSAQGFLHGVAGGVPGSSLVTPLKPTAWRTSEKDYVTATKGTYGGRATFIVRDWFYIHSGGQTSWTDFTNYENYVKALVHQSIDEGWPIDYWDVMNEPDSPADPAKIPATAEDGSRSCAGNDPCLAITQLQEIEHAVSAIRSVDPNAKIVVPSLNKFRASPAVPQTGPALARMLDLETVLDYLVLRNIKVDAISWHELSNFRSDNYDYPIPQAVRDLDNTKYVSSPRVVLDHVAQARALIAARPSLGNLEIHINEFGPVASTMVPGWEAGWLNAMEDANVDLGSRSCWQLQEGTSVNDGCFGPAPGHASGRLDGLLTNGTVQNPKAAYWVHRFYADMTGTRVATTTSDPQFGHGPPDDGTHTSADITSAFATRDDATSTVRTMVGRHYSCTPASNALCAGGIRQWDSYRPVAPTAPGAVLVKWPYASGSVNVTVKRIPNTDVQGPLASGPVAVSTTTATAVSGQDLRVDLGSVADGEAYTVTVSP